MKDCNNCKHKDCWEYADPCDSCTNLTGEPTNWEPHTRADRIRAMTDADLANFISEVKIDGLLRKYELPTSAIHWLEWLEQEAQDAAY